jgi:hypothetical protein
LKNLTTCLKGWSQPRAFLTTRLASKVFISA